MSNYYWSVQWRWMRKYVMAILIGIIVATILFIVSFLYLQKAQAMSYYDIKNCIASYKAINQIGVKPLRNVGDCVDNPKVIS